MIYDKEIQILSLPPTIGTPLQGKLQQEFSAYCGELTVYHSRYWEAVQAGSRVDLLVELPLRRDVKAEMYAKFEGHIYRIEQVQFGHDKDRLAVTWLSLQRSEVAYDIADI